MGEIMTTDDEGLLITFGFKLLEYADVMDYQEFTINYKVYPYCDILSNTSTETERYLLYTIWYPETEYILDMTFEV